jgi:hypothetical protein
MINRFQRIQLKKVGVGKVKTLSEKKNIKKTVITPRMKNKSDPKIDTLVNVRDF